MEDEEEVSNKIISIIRNYRLPLILVLIGTVFIAGSVILLSNKKGVSEIAFVEKSSSLSAGTKIRVDVEGGIEKPGVYEMTMGSRVDDLLVAAGGLSSSADRVAIAKSLNRAAKLNDGAKLYIPQVGDNIVNSTGIVAGANNNSLKAQININEASLSELDNLPGVGPVTAEKIISGRPYQTVDELKSKKIIGNALFENIKDLVGVY